MDEHLVRLHFAAVYSPACTGIEKPNLLAFERVIQDHPEARRGWMIGDNWKADVVGAERVGMRAILVRRQHPDATLQCATLHEAAERVDRAAAGG